MRTRSPAAPWATPSAQGLSALGEEEGRDGVVDPLELVAVGVPAVGVGRRRGGEQRQVAHGLLEDHVGGVLVALVGEAGQPHQRRGGSVGAADRLRRRGGDESEEDELGAHIAFSQSGRPQLHRWKVPAAPARVAYGAGVLPGIGFMAISKELLDILVCPVSKGALELTADGKFLVCRESKLVYRIEDDIPIMLADEAIPLDEWERQQHGGA
jgi:uncharacterized protein